MIMTEFDQVEKAKAWVGILKDMVGSMCGKLINPNTKLPTDHPAIYLANQNKTIPEATYPLIEVRVLPYVDENAYLLDKGLITIEDPENPPDEITVPYTSSHIYYSLQLTCIGNDNMSSQLILERIRGSMNFDRWKKRVNTDMQSGWQVKSRVSYTPFLEEGNWITQHTLICNFTTVSTIIDYEGSWFNVIEFKAGKVYRNPDDPSPIETPIRTVGPAY